MALKKDPDAVLDYVFDWSIWLAEGETIVTATVEVVSGDVVVDSVSFTDEAVTAWLSGGTLDTDAELRCRVTTSEDRTDDRTAVVLIRESFATEGCETWPYIGYTPPEDADPEVLAAAIEAAQAFLKGATGGRFGTCVYTQRFQVRQGPNGVTCDLPYTGPYNRSTAPSTCCAIRLPNTPIQRIDRVRVDGVELHPSNYVLLGGTRLARIAGCWPVSMDNVPGRVEVTYTAGISLHPGSTYYGMAAAAMGEVLREYMSAFTGGGACKLPSRFVSVARQGVTTTALDPSMFLDLGLTGLPLTDNFIRTVNPNGLRRRPRVLAVDGPRRN